MANHHIGQDVIAVAFAKQLDTTGEIRVPTTGIWEIVTKNSVYRFDADNGTMSGGIIGNKSVKAAINGSSFGGSMVKAGWLIPGSLLDFNYEGSGGAWITSSPIREIRGPLTPELAASSAQENGDGISPTCSRAEGEKGGKS